MLPSKLLITTLAAGLAFCVPDSQFGSSVEAGSQSRDSGDILAVNSIIPDSYIVVMKDHVSDEAFHNHLNIVPRSLGPITTEKFDIGGFKGYTAEFSPSVLKVLKKDPDVAYIEPDATVSIYAITTQFDAPWGLHRISHKNPVTNFTNYVYDSSGGQDTYVYVLDTGVYADHREFEGRATYGANFAESSEPDGNGHGTHVAAIIGSRLYGVAKKTNLIGVKILNTYGMGRQSWVLQGLAWAVNDARDKKRLGSSFANMSLGGPYSEAVNSAVAAVVRAGLFMGVAAGNDGRPASRFSPASEPLACTVGATDIDDSRAPYSNYGHSVDIFAPGTDILSAGIRSGFDNDVLSGTSMAVPHVVGLAAYLRALEGQERTPTEWCERLRELALRGVVSKKTRGRSAELLGNNGNGVF